MGDLDLEGRISFRDESAAGLAAITSRLDTIIGKLDQVGEHAKHAKEHSESFANEMVKQFAEVAAAALTVEKAFEFMIEGIKKADEIRDLTLSLGVFSGSMEKGVEAMEFFNKAAAQTRDTGDELAKMYRDTLPLAISRGFSQDSMQHITVWLSQLSTIAGQSSEAMQSGFQQLLSGRVSAGRNPLLKVLGITKADIDGLGWDQIVTKMEEVSRHFPEFGQSWESTMHKAKDELLKAFGEGFNEARGSAGSGMAGINAAVLTAIPYIREVGKYIAEIAPTVVRAFEGAAGALRIFVGGLETGAGLIVGVAAHIVDDIVSLSGRGIATLLENIAAFERAIPRDVINTLEALTPGVHLGDLDKGAAQMDAWAQKIRAAVSSVHESVSSVAGVAEERMEHGAEQVRAGIEMVTNAQQPLAAATHATGVATTGLDDSMKKLLGSLGNVAIDTTGAGKSLKEFNQILAQSTQLALALAKAADEASYKAALALAPDDMSKAMLEYERSLVLQFDQDAIQRGKIAEIQQKLNAAVKQYGELSPQTQGIREELQKAGDALESINASSKDLATGNYLSNALKGVYDLADPEVMRAMQQLTQMLSGLAFSSSSFNPLAMMNEQLRKQQQISPEDFASAGTLVPDLATALATGVINEGLGATLGKQFTDAVRDYWRSDGLGAKTGASMAQGFENIFLDIAQTGGKNFGRVAGEMLTTISTDFLGQIGKIISADVIGRPGDPSKGTGEVAGQFYDSQGQNITKRSLGAQATIAGVGIAYGGYQAGLSGQSGARSGATLSGAASGAAIGTEILPGWGTVIGAAVGALVGAIGGAIGAAQRQSEYKFGVPTIHDGTATFTGNKNIQAAQQEQIRNQIQEAYDSMHDQLVNVFMKVAGAAIPGRADLGGAIQPEASAHFMEHLQQWIDQTLPKAELNTFKGEAANIAVSLGMTKGKFLEIFGGLEKIDPKKVPAILDQLFTSLVDLHKITTYWAGSDLAHATSPVSNDKLDFGNNAVWFGADQSRQSIAAPFADLDKQIMQIAMHIKGLSPEGQIAAFQQLTGLMRQRDDMLRAAAMELYNLAKSVKDQLRADTQTLDIQRFRNKDGSPDQFAISQYYKHQAEQDMFAISSAANPAEAAAAWAKLRADVMAAENAGFSQATEDQKDLWINWAQGVLNTGQNAITAAINRFGGSINDINSTFNSQVDPAIHAFTSAITDTSGKIGGIGDDLDKIRVPIRGVGDGMNALSTDIANVRAEVVAFGEYLKSISDNKSDTLSTTVSGRAA
jgi:hypothetical protein